jgi:hypothetical protein
MRRALIVWSGIGLLLAAAGCTMCAHPYDYCGPVTDGCCGCSCDTRVRTASVLSGTAGGPVEGEQVVAGQEYADAGTDGATVVAQPTVVGQPTVTEGPVLQDGGAVDEQQVISPVPAGARRYSRTRPMR